MIGKILGSKWLLAAGGVLILALAAMTHAYLGKRDDLAVARAEIQDWQTSNQALQDALQRQARLQAEAEQARIRLAAELDELRVQEVQVVTKIREVFRDREVVTEVQADCAAEPMPGRVVGMLCDVAGSRAGICSMPEAAGGPDDPVPDPGPAR